MSGTDQARRNAEELLIAKLIASAVVRRDGGSWDEHPLSEWPTAIVTEDGRPRFLYGDPDGALRTYHVSPGPPLTSAPWRTEPPSILIESFASEEVIEVTAYAESGEVVWREVAAG